MTTPGFFLAHQRKLGFFIIALFEVMAMEAYAADPSYAWSHFAGSPSGEGGSTDGAVNDARFYGPRSVAIDNSGNFLVADGGNHSIRKITPAGVVSTFAGDPRFAGTADGTGSAARFERPSGIALDPWGNIYVSDDDAPTIRKITPAGEVSTFAGSPDAYGSTDGIGSAARFTSIYGVAADSLGNVYVADTLNYTIRKITPDGSVSTFAGSAELSGSTDGVGSDARFGYPSGVAVDRSGNVFVADAQNSVIRKITPDRRVTTIAGSAGLIGDADGVGSDARFVSPSGIAVDLAGNVYIGDPDAHMIRKITPSLMVSTLGGVGGSQGQTDGTGSAARFRFPWGVVVDSTGNLFVAELGNNAIRRGSALETSPARLVNISTRSFAGSGSSTQIAGFIIGGLSARKVLIRAGGPYLDQFGVPGTLSDPVLTLYEGSTPILTNDDWSTNAMEVTEASTKVGAVGFSAGGKDAALVATLRPGIPYTAIVTGKGSATGAAIVEAYDADDGLDSRLVNISTRSFVGVGGNIQIGGFILKGQGARKVLIRAGGPYLSQYGVDGVLADPVLTVFQGSTAIAQNDDWGSNASEVTEATLAANLTAFSAGSKDSAVVLTLNADAGYTAQVSGKDGSTGNAIIEIYEVRQ